MDEASPEDVAESFGNKEKLGICQVLERLEAVRDDLIKR